MLMLLDITLQYMHNCMTRHFYACLRDVHLHTGKMSALYVLKL